MMQFKKSLYVGEFRHHVDSKGRLTLPSKWRFSGDETALYLGLPNPSGCITIYPPQMVEKLESKVSEVSLGDKKGQKALTRLFSKADTFSFDKQGRINLSEKLLTHAGIDKEAVWVGNFASMHIWNPQNYSQYLASDDDTSDEMAEVLIQLGL